MTKLQELEKEVEKVLKDAADNPLDFKKQAKVGGVLREYCVALNEQQETELRMIGG